MGNTWLVVTPIKPIDDDQEIVGEVQCFNYDCDMMSEDNYCVFDVADPVLEKKAALKTKVKVPPLCLKKAVPGAFPFQLPLAMGQPIVCAIDLDEEQ
eukprot:gene14774-17285_t